MMMMMTNGNVASTTNLPINQSINKSIQKRLDLISFNKQTIIYKNTFATFDFNNKLGIEYFSIS
jgi:ubiquinone biosynthesis protein COQ9